MKEGSLGVGTVLFLSFMILKLRGVIFWSWWWITAPIWIPIAIILAVVIVYMLWQQIAKQQINQNKLKIINILKYEQ